jgi:glycosyltransferase involved in cell wall biosynthesis
VRIAIDASRTTVARITGTERYALELLRALVRMNQRHDLMLYFRDAPHRDLFSTNTPATILSMRRVWTHLRFAAEIWRTRPDVTFVPAHTLPFAFPGQAVVTVHDLGYRYFPQAHPTPQRLYLDLTTRYSAARATRILADSEATARDLMRFYGTPRDKVRVVYPGVDVPMVGDLAAVRAKYRLPERYWLYIGTLQPRKNIGVIVEGYRRWRAAHSGDNSALVLAGGRGWLYDSAWTAGFEGVIETGYIDESDKGALLTGARALLFPSLYEGFGFPVLEALGCGTPVICSDSSSLPEVGGALASYVPLPPEVLESDPGTDLVAAFTAMADALAAAMAALGDEAYLPSAREARKAWAATYTWERAAREVLGVFDELD